MALWIYDVMAHWNYTYSPLHDMNSLVTFLKRKKVDVRRFHSESELSEVFKDEDAVVFTEYKPDIGLQSLIVACNARNVPVFSETPISSLQGCYYSSFWANSVGVILDILSYFFQNGKRRIAYFGACNSATDNTNISSLFSNYPAFDYGDIFYLDEISIQETFNEFYSVRENYDAVICSNDMVGVYFLSELKADPEYANNTFIMSYMNSILSRICHIPLSSSSFSREMLPQIILNIYRSFLKTKNMFNSQILTLESKMYCRESTNCVPFEPSVRYIPNLTSSIRTYTPSEKAVFDTRDVRLRKLINLEAMLRRCNKDDLLFLFMLLKGCSTEEICQELFISPQTVTYRSGVLFKALGIKSKKELRDFYLKYISLDNLEKYIDNKDLRE